MCKLIFVTSLRRTARMFAGANPFGGSNLSSHGKSRSEDRLIPWLGFGYGNMTFEDSLDFDISEIESV